MSCLKIPGDVIPRTRLWLVQLYYINMFYFYFSEALQCSSPQKAIK